MGIGQLFMRVWRMNVSKSLGRNVSQEEMNRAIRGILTWAFCIKDFAASSYRTGI